MPFFCLTFFCLFDPQWPNLLLLPTAPQKPRGDGAIWPPAALFGDLLDLDGGREMIESIKLLDGAPDAQIADRQHVHTAERKDQKHMRRPDADALDLREHLNYLVVAHLRHAVEFERAVLSLRGDVFDEGDLAVRHPRRAQRLVRSRENPLRLREAVRRVDRFEAVADRVRRFRRQLLRDHGLDKSLEIPVVRTDAARPVTLDQSPQTLIAPRQAPLRFFQLRDKCR